MTGNAVSEERLARRVADSPALDVCVYIGIEAMDVLGVVSIPGRRLEVSIAAEHGDANVDAAGLKAAEHPDG
jgi:hypothetical protein